MNFSHKLKYNWGSDISYKFRINSLPQKEIMSLKLSKTINFLKLSGTLIIRIKKISLKDIEIKGV